MEYAGSEPRGPSAHDTFETVTDPLHFPRNSRARDASGLAPDVGGDVEQRNEGDQSASTRAAAAANVSENVDADSEEPPPPFAPYEAEYFLSTRGDIISHDHHLNEDGEALYRFLLTHAAAPPLYTVHLCGTHSERRTRVVSYADSQGHTQTYEEKYKVTITDFAFALDLTHALVPGGPAPWSVPDSAPAYRGLMVRQVAVPARRGGRDAGGDAEAGEGGGGAVDWIGREVVMRKAAKEEVAEFKAEERLRLESGAAPWEMPNGGGSRAPQEASSKTVRAWADAYAASPKLLKEFVYEKKVYGWSTSALTAALYQTISNTPSSATSFSVDFDLSCTKIIVRPDTLPARLMSLRNISHWWTALLWITLIYPVLWLFRRYARHGGGRWAVCGGAYALKIVEHALPNQSSGERAFPQPTFGGVLSDSTVILDGGEEAQRAWAFATALPPVEDEAGYNPRYLVQPHPFVPSAPYFFQPKPPNSRLVATSRGGAVRITGFREGEWFRAWEPTIRRCVMTRMQQDEPFVQPDMMSVNDVEEPGVVLDGY